MSSIRVNLLLARSKLSKVLSLLVVFGIVNMALVVPVEDPLVKYMIDLLPFTLEAVNLRISLNQIHLHCLKLLELLLDHPLLLPLHFSLFKDLSP